MINKLANQSVTQLESIISRYPWFSLARKELYLRTSLMGEEYRILGMKRAGVYVPSRERLNMEGYSVGAGKSCTSPGDTEVDNIDKQTIRVIGGDWFSAEDLNSIEQEHFAIDENTGIFTEPAGTDVRVPEELFYTETLARIYGEQELHQMAIDIYEKLILIYPEKSTYFASLIEEQKKHLKD